MTFKDLLPGNKFIITPENGKAVLFLRTDTGIVAVTSGQSAGLISPDTDVIKIY
jgi:hypothetical protein